MPKFRFNLREPESKDPTPIYLIIRYDKNRLVYPTKESIPPKFWQSDKKKENYQRAKQTNRFPENSEINERLDDILLTAKRVYRNYLSDNENRLPSIKKLRELLDLELNRNNGKIKHTLFSFIDQYIKEGERILISKGRRIDRNSVVNTYKQTKQILTDYSLAKNVKLDFEDITLDFYYDFVNYMEEVKKFSVNNIGKHIKTLKSILNEATEREFNSNIAFKSKRFKTLTEEVDSIYLDEKELQELYNLDLSNNPKLDRVRDLFLIGCWTGLRFSDFTKLNINNIKNDFIEIETQKTGEKVVIPIHPIVKEILKKHDNKPGNLPRPLSNVKMNEYLKDLGKFETENKKKIKSLHKDIPVTYTKEGIKRTVKRKKYKLITTHTARRSFATNLYLEGFPSISIMKITGHKTEKAFLKYIKITPKENAKLLQLHWQKNQILEKVK